MQTGLDSAPSAAVSPRAMRTRSLGRSSVQTPEIGLGTWSLAGEAYGGVTPEDARATLEAALDEGASFLETADCYGEGRVETLIGEVLKARGRDKALVSTRVGVDRSGEITRKDFSPKYLTAACERSLKRLQTDHVDALVLHNPQVGTLTKGDAWRCLEALKGAGKARLLGVSVGSVDAAEAAVALGADLLVVPYNLFFSKLLHSIAGLVSSGPRGPVGVVVRSPLGYGVLADTWGASRRFNEDDHRMYRWSTADLATRVRQREALRVLVEGDVRSIRELALRYVLANGVVSVVVPGARRAEHARENAHAADALPYLSDRALTSVGTLLSGAA